MPTICFATLGCKVNQVDTAYLTDAFAAAGYDLVAWPGPADVCIVNTCSVTARADRQSRQLVKRARRSNPASLVVVTGCSPMTADHPETAFAEADLVTGNLEKDRLLSLLAALRLGDRRRVVDDIAPADRIQAGGAFELQQRTRAFLKVQDGCPGRCTYCIVPRVRGHSRSVAPETALYAVRGLVVLGHREVVLTGIHLGCYGEDAPDGRGLAELCRRILAETDLPRLRISSLEPNEVTPELIDLMATNERFCRHLHIPLQSGSESVLRRMNRPYTLAAYEALIRRLRDSVPNITLGADLIVGFPGEDDAAFAETRQTLERLRLPHWHIFPYSDRPGTPASAMPGKVSRQVIHDRAARIREIVGPHRRAHLEAQIGLTLDVLIETSGADESEGLSRNYLPVRAAARLESGNECPLRIVRVVADDEHPHLLGELSSSK
ncbi:MAG: tRNA (N(6)-L-threonylcarbamoyladenosine(37)-C(2))-methylthiotransferase MtaB [Myxococcales bacterium]|nr:tRNA (N(6)-L-threonylcarbamoyladenosine(37)-C(2))-methylthiotransferase MtaB [Myxococcales bacterium]